ncbi:uncharacterized protein TrAtP1_010454 [Trichoderma atroviride]|uniref:uncharacterized protein n=1 Tax=Hypocrea atroviridis TaxID=63577 RepID=UPI003318805C|nr:hypothetical protein TrAtP1_010454 [Trichoderma atroviride]
MGSPALESEPAAIRPVPVNLESSTETGIKWMHVSSCRWQDRGFSQAEALPPFHASLAAKTYDLVSFPGLTCLSSPFQSHGRRLLSQQDDARLCCRVSALPTRPSALSHTESYVQVLGAIRGHWLARKALATSH